MRYYNNNNYYSPSGFGGFKLFPPMIKMLLIVNLGLFLLQFLLNSFTLNGIPIHNYIIRYFALIPLGYGFRIWQLITYMFLHGDFTHIFFNMFALWMFGAEIENYLGSRKFISFYFTCGVGAAIANLLLSPLFYTPAPTLGASGAVYGVLLAFAVLFPDRYIFLYFLLPVKVKYFVACYILLEIFAVGSNDFVAHLAHLGGALTGYIFVLIELKKFPFQKTFNSVYYDSKTETKHPPTYSQDIKEATYYDINSGREIKSNDGFSQSKINQEIIDKILDKISQGGYQSLTAEEKKILFEASKHLD
jgi:membrane associated rhomboid family serine protease